MNIFDLCPEFETLEEIETALEYGYFPIFDDDVEEEKKKMTKYQKEKEVARQKATEWQARQADQDLSYGEYAYFAEYFAKLSRRYGLTREFRENGII